MCQMACNDWSIIMVHDKLLVSKLRVIYKQINDTIVSQAEFIFNPLALKSVKKCFVKCECWLSLHTCI